MMDSEQIARELLADELSKAEDTRAAARRIRMDFPTDVEKAALRAIRRALEQREAVPTVLAWDEKLSCFVATPPRDVPEAVIAEAVNRAIAAVEPMYGERQDTWIARVREHARAMLAAAPPGEVGNSNSAATPQDTPPT